MSAMRIASEIPVATPPSTIVTAALNEEGVIRHQRFLLRGIVTLAGAVLLFWPSL